MEKKNTNSSKNTNNTNSKTNIIATGVVVLDSKDVTKSDGEIKEKIADELKKQRTAEPQTDGGQTESGRMPVDEPKATVEEMKRQLEAELKKLEAKQEAAKKREVFLEAKTNLDELRELLRKTREFETEHCKLILSRLASAGYTAEYRPMFSITNREILEKFCGWLDKEIDIKLEELENELLK